MVKGLLTILFLTLIGTLVSIGQDKMLQISGSVLSEGEPLPGATVILKGSGPSVGTIADLDGHFELTVPEQSVLVVSFVGFKSKEVLVINDQPLVIHLDVDYQQMDEVVVVGYGTMKKSDLTGSVSSIKADDLKATALTSLDQGLQGRASGVVVMQTSGQPGAATTIRIRGTSSIHGNNEPLYVIDGIPIISDASLGAVGATQGPSLNPLVSINPRDIESVEILKDASATAIYGARGANGVILVTTKRGSGEARVSLDYYYGIQEVRRKMPMLKASELAILGNEAADNEEVNRKLIYASPTNLGDGVDWQDQIFRLAPIQNIQASASGGNERTNYAVSASYFSQDGIVIGSGFKKGNFRLNLDQKLSEILTVGTSLNINRSVLDGVVTDSEGAAASSVTSWALEFNPGIPIYTETGEYTAEDTIATPNIGNPVVDALETQQLTKSSRIIGNIYLKWKITEALELKNSVSTDAYFNEEQSFVPNFLKRAEASNGQAALGDSKGYTWLMENVLSYHKAISGDHLLNVVVGHTLQKLYSNFFYVATSDFDDNRLGYHAIQAGKKKTLALSGSSGWQMQSVLSRVNYSLMDKYLLTFSGRVDGSSKFGEGNKYGFFPSIALSWRISDEAFLTHSSLISDLKLRTSYGLVGNEGIPAYRSLGLLEVTEAYFGEKEIAKGVGPSTLENKKLRWETTGQLDIGLDLGLFDNRISVTTDAYMKETTDLLLNAPVPYVSGFAFAYTNIGTLINQGLEFSVNSFNTVNEFQWKTNFTIGFNRNEITKLTGQDDEGLVGQNILGINGWTRITEGQPIGTFYGYESEGIIQLDEKRYIPAFLNYDPKYGDRKYVDQDDNGILDEADKIILGNANPDFSFGMGNSFEYKGFSLNIFLQGVYGNEIVNFNRFGLESFDGLRNNSTAALKRWTPENPTNEYPRATVLPRPSHTLSDVQVEDGSYLRVKDITLSYRFPATLTDRMKLAQLSIYISAKNAYTLTNYSGFDPEVSRFANDNLSMGADYGSYPMSKVYMTGISISF